MIPYDELVIALQTWRAKQGLPVAKLSGALTPPPGAKPAVVPAAPGGSEPRATPPTAPGARGQGPANPPPLAAGEDSLDVDDGALLEESHYENEGDDFAMAFGAGKLEHDAELTAIGLPPTDRPSNDFGQPTDPGTDHADTDDRPLKSGHNRNTDW